MNFHRNLLHSSFMIYWCPCRAASLLCLVVLSSSASSHIIGVNGFTASCLRRHFCPWHVSGDVAGAVSQLSSLCRGAGWFPTPRPPHPHKRKIERHNFQKKGAKLERAGGGVSLNSGTSGGGVSRPVERAGGGVSLNSGTSGGGGVIYFLFFCIGFATKGARTQNQPKTSISNIFCVAQMRFER